MVLVGLLVGCATGLVWAQDAASLGAVDRDRTKVANGIAPGRSIPDLRSGQTIKRTLRDGESHAFTVALKAGEYIKLVAESHEIDFNLSVVDPNGNDNAGMALGREGQTDSLWLAAQVTGDYQIKITAPAGQPVSGDYLINLERVGDLKSAPLSDQTHLTAAQSTWDARLLGIQGGEEALNRAAEKYQQALPLWRDLGERAEEAFTLNELARVYDRLAEPQKAVELYQQALVSWRLLENHKKDLAATLYNLGSIYSAEGKVAEALSCYQEAITVRRLINDKGGLAYVLTNLGQLYINVGEFEQALKSQEEALALRREIGDIAGQARSLSNISGVSFNLGEYQDALNYCLQALPLRRDSGDRRGEGVTLANIGSIYRELGEPQKAINYYQQALSLVRQQPDRLVERSVLDATGRNYFDLGDYSKALDYYNQALSLTQAQIDSYGKAATLTNIGSVYARLGDREKSLAYFEQSLQLQRDIGDRRGELITLQLAGQLYHQAGDLKKASDYFHQGLDLSRSIKNRLGEANLLYDIARTEKDAGNPSDARAHVEAAIVIIESTRAQVTTGELRSSFFASKQDLYELDIDLLMQSVRQDQDPQSLVKAFTLSEQRRARGLLESLGETRTRTLRGVSPEILSRERELRAKLNQKTEREIKLLSGKPTPEQAAASVKDVDTTATDYEQLLTEIRAVSPFYASLNQPAPLSLADIRTKVLDPDALLLEYSLGKERSYLWAVTSTDIKGYELPGRAEIEGQARNVYDLLTARNQFVKFEKPGEKEARIAKADSEYFHASMRLSQVLLGPVAGSLTGKRLLIVSDGALQYLPFAALPSPIAAARKGNEQTTGETFRPLIADHEVTSLPSAAILDVLRREVTGRKPAPKTVAVLADPVFSKTDERVTGAKPVSNAEDQRSKTGRVDTRLESELVRAVRDFDGENGLEIGRLPSTHQEAAAILALTPKADQFQALGFDANVSAATSPELSQYRIVHFATHGLLNSRHPGLSGLVFSLVDREGNDRNGFLPAHEIFDLNLPADLVVLSGCRTGLGKEIKGEGVMGLTRGFFYAGAARVAVSLWDVNDKSTAELMARFYHGMLGQSHLSPTAALKQAQVSMWKTNRWTAPYYWAAFVVQGEYR